MPFLLYVDFDHFLVPAEQNKESAANTKVQQIHKPSRFACIPSPRYRGLIGDITYSGEDWLTVFFEHIKDQDRYVRSILSDVKSLKTVMAKQQLQHAAATTCELCHGKFTKKNRQAKHHCHLSGLYIGPYFNTCNL